MAVVTKSAQETEQAGEDVVADIMDEMKERGKPGTATVIGLKGELGAGKTTFMKGVARALSVPDTITSPTFVIEKVYELPDELPFDHLIHIDAYRIEESRELISLGWHEILSDPKNIIFVEWPERVEDIMPHRTIEILFAVKGREEREIRYIDEK